MKAALAYYQTSKVWPVRYCHSLVPNVSPVYKDVAADPALQTHQFYETKKRTINTYYVDSLKHSSSTANELLAVKRWRHRPRGGDPRADRHKS